MSGVAVMPALFDVVVLTDVIAGAAVDPGAVGTIVLVFDEPSEAYEVEFCDGEGRTVEQLPLRKSQFTVRQPHRGRDT